MAALFLVWIVLEEEEVPLRHIHVAMYSEKTHMLAQKKISTKKPEAAGKLLHALELGKRSYITSPMLILHI